MHAYESLADVRADMARYRLPTRELAAAMGMSYGRCSTLINGDPLLELTSHGAEQFASAVRAVRDQREAVA